VIIIGTLGKVHAKLSIEIFDSFTFARSHHQQRSALIPGGKLASFIFIGLNPGPSKAHSCQQRVAETKREKNTGISKPSGGSVL
jgi:hypothetical protein